MSSKEDDHCEFLVRTLRLAAYTGVFLIHLCMLMYIYMYTNACMYICINYASNKNYLKFLHVNLMYVICDYFILITTDIEFHYV